MKESPTGRVFLLILTLILVLPVNSQSYAPINVSCPSDLIRSGDNGLSPLESQYISQRKIKATESLVAWLEHVNLTDFNVSSFLANERNAPTLAIAFSGGGYRAMLNGAGLDGRVTGNGNMSGFLQTNTYISGLSGGSWLIGPVAVHDFATVDTLRNDYWHLEDNLVAPSGLANKTKLYTDMYNQVQQKVDAGFNTTISNSSFILHADILADYWGAALGRQLINRTNGGPDITYSSITNTSSFQSYMQPFPLIIMDGRGPGQIIVDINSTLYEISPYEFGTWDNDINLFVSTKYLGSNLTYGNATNGNICVEQFDNAAFVIGTSSSLFNQALLYLPQDNVSVAQQVLESVLQSFSESEEDIAWYPNPFKAVNSSNNTVASDPSLTLVDGGEDKQNIPLWPLLQKERNVDFIFAVDSSADIQGWPNGISMVATYEKFILNDTSDVVFPYVPDPQTFINLGLNSRPTFFGCNASNYTSYSRIPPLVMYFPHVPWTGFTNYSTFALQYTQSEVDAFIKNGVAMAGNSTTWPACLACAVLQRAKERANVPVGDQCQECFNKYCWNGTINTTTSTYNPVLESNNGTFQTEGQAGNTTSYGAKSVEIPTFCRLTAILGLILMLQGLYLASLF